MPIDKRFRSTWKVKSAHRGHSVWNESSLVQGEIHGDVVGIHIESCIGCMKCVSGCPTNVFDEWIPEENNPVVDPVREDDCILCLVCEIVCPTEAIDIKREGGSQDTLDSLLRGE